MLVSPLYDSHCYKLLVNAYAMVGEVFHIRKSSQIKKILQNVLARVEEILTDNVMKRSGMRGSNENFQSIHAIKTKIHKSMMTFSLLEDFLMAPTSAARSSGLTFDHCSVVQFR